MYYIVLRKREGRAAVRLQVEKRLPDYSAASGARLLVRSSRAQSRSS
jgi:hypothetical protein